MPEALETVLRLVADGRLSAEEAGPIIAALQAEGGPAPSESRGRRAAPDRAEATPGIARQVRIEVTDRGRPVVNLRLPVALGQAAMAMVPGLSSENTSRLKDALAVGRIGPILDVLDEDGDGVRIVLE